MRHFACAPLAGLVCVMLLGGCKPAEKLVGGDDAELTKLRAEVQRLRKENADLRISPTALAAEVDAAIRSGNEEKAAAAFKQMSDTFPVAAETTEMRKRLEAFHVQRRAQEDEEKRVAALGFRALPINPLFARGDTAVSLASVNLTKRWIFDWYGDGWRFTDADKDGKMLVARLNVSSKLKEPALFGVAAYAPDGAKLSQLGSMRYRFARWSSYAAFLGTQADFRNEFTHSFKIPFTAGVSISDENLKRRPIYLVATAEGCHERHFERFGQPPVFYLPGTCKTLKPTLTVDDFKSGSLAILKRID